MGKIVVRTGRGTRTFNAVDNSFSSFISDAILNDGIKLSAKRRFDLMLRLGGRIEQAVNQSLTQIIPFVVRNLMGLETPQSGARVISTEDMLRMTGTEHLLEETTHHPIFGQVIWPALTGSTVKRKLVGKSGRSRVKYFGNAYKFFIHTGALQSQLAGKAATLAAILGNTRVLYREQPETTKFGRKIKVGTLTVKIAPSASAGIVPGLRTGNWASSDARVPLERRLGLSGRAIEKLRGPIVGHSSYIRHRPLLQPAAAFWLLFRVPLAIQSIIRRSAFRISTKGGSTSSSSLEN